MSRRIASIVAYLAAGVLAYFVISGIYTTLQSQFDHVAQKTIAHPWVWWHPVIFIVVIAGVSFIWAFNTLDEPTPSHDELPRYPPITPEERVILNELRSHAKRDSQ